MAWSKVDSSLFVFLHNCTPNVVIFIVNKNLWMNNLLFLNQIQDELDVFERSTTIDIIDMFIGRNISLYIIQFHKINFKKNAGIQAGSA